MGRALAQPTLNECVGLLSVIWLPTMILHSEVEKITWISTPDQFDALQREGMVDFASVFC